MPGRPFTKGTSGNPVGKPRGARHKATLAVEALLEGEAEALSRKAIELALEGNVIALRLCIDRIAPPRKGRPVAFDLSADLRSAADLAEAQATVLRSMSEGVLSPEEAADVARVIECVGVALERRELEQRIEALEKAQGDAAKETAP